MVSGGGALHDGDELHPLGLQLVAEELVDAAPMMLVGGVDGAEDVEVHAVLPQLLPALHDEVEGALATAGDAVRIVDVARTIHAQSDKEVVLLEEGAPLVVEGDAIGLEGVLDALAGPAVLLDQRDGPAEEVHAHEGGFPALPRYRDAGVAMGLEQLPDVGLKRGRGHPVLLVGIECFLREKEAVLAIDVAGGPAGLGEQVEPWRRTRRDLWIENRHRVCFHGSCLLIRQTQPPVAAAVMVSTT